MPTFSTKCSCRRLSKQFSFLILLLVVHLSQKVSFSKGFEEYWCSCDVHPHIMFIRSRNVNTYYILFYISYLKNYHIQVSTFGWRTLEHQKCYFGENSKIWERCSGLVRSCKIYLNNPHPSIFLNYPAITCSFRCLHYDSYQCKLPLA